MEYVYSFLGYNIGKQLTLTLYSLIIGAVLGVLFDVFRISRVFLAYDGEGRAFKKASKTVLFAVSLIEDIAFFIISALTLIIFCFKANFGTARSFIFWGTAVGFVLYLFSIGRLTMLISNTLSHLLYRLLSFVRRRIILPIALIIKNIFLKLYGATIRRGVHAFARYLHIRNMKKTSRELMSVILRLYIENEGKDNGDETVQNSNAGEACNIRGIHNNGSHPRWSSDRIQSARGGARQASS